MSETSPKWIDIGPLDAVPIKGARVVKTGEGCIAVFRTASGEAFAIDDACPHKAGPLSQGIVHGASVTCPLHNWEISLETGKVLGADEGHQFAGVAELAHAAVAAGQVAAQQPGPGGEHQGAHEPGIHQHPQAHPTPLGLAKGIAHTLV